MHLRSQRKQSRDVSLQEPIGQDKEGNEVSLLDVLSTEGEEEVLETIQFRLDRTRIYDGLAALTKREREIIRARFGLPGGTEKTQREIARELGISRSYVSRIEKRALEKLQQEFQQKAE